MPRRAALAAALLAAAVGTGARAQDAREGQRQVFRAGAHYVRVDAYPARDGRALLNLTADDFEVLEDGTPQKIETFEFIEYEGRTPQAHRSDPNSQRDAFTLASDPRYRVFVLYLDVFNVGFDGSHRLRMPIVELLSRMLGPRDLFGLLTPVQSPRKDLILGQLSQSIEEQFLRHPDWGLADRPLTPIDAAEEELLFVFPGRRGERLVALRRLDKVYADLEELVTLLGELRDERKNILFVSDALASPRVSMSRMTLAPPGSRGSPPPIGVSSEGKLTMGARDPGGPDRRRAGVEEERLNSIDFHLRFRDMVRRARQANVAFYTVRPGGLSASGSLMSDSLGNLEVLAEQTDGVAITHSNDLRNGLSRVANDLSSHYVLGYYTGNTKWDGGTRSITVRLKKTGERIRARREYRAPTEADMAAIRDARNAAAAAPAGPSPIEAALGALTRMRPGAPVHMYATANGGELAVVAEIAASAIEAGRWKQGGEVQVLTSFANGRSVSGTGRIVPGLRGAVVRLDVGTDPGPWQAMVRVRGDGEPPHSDSITITRSTGVLLGDPIGYRAAAAAAAPFGPLAAFSLRRTERIRLEWPLVKRIDSHTVRLLDKKGQPLDVRVVSAVGGAEGKTLSAEINLAPLAIGEYLIEVSATAGAVVERKLVAIRVALAR